MPVKAQEELCVTLVCVLVVGALPVYGQPVIAVLFNLPGVAGVARQGALIGSLLKLTVKLSQENHDAIQLLRQGLEAFGDQPVSQVITLRLIGSHQRQVVNEDHPNLAAFALDAT